MDVFKVGDAVGFKHDFAGLVGTVVFVGNAIIVKWVNSNGAFFHAEYTPEEVEKWGVVHK